jgi:hypothetical protein
LKFQHLCFVIFKGLFQDYSSKQACHLDNFVQLLVFLSRGILPVATIEPMDNTLVLVSETVVPDWYFSALMIKFGISLRLMVLSFENNFFCSQ